MSAAGATPQAQLVTLGLSASGGGGSGATNTGGISGSSTNSATNSASAAASGSQNAAAAAAVANAAAAAQTAGVSNVVGGGFGGGASSLSLPANSIPFGMGLPMGIGGFPFGAQQFIQQQAAAQQAAAASSGTPGKSSKKQKGPSGSVVPPPPPANNTLTAAQIAHFQQLAASQNNLPLNNPYGFLHNYALGGAPAAGTTDGAPRGRWSEEMTFRLIELRTKMDGRFRTVARPDKLWYEITQAICTEFGATLPKQSTKDKWKNLRSSFRLINQGKHPSHYTKETWPFYSQLERYVEQKAEFDKHPDGPLPTLGALIDTSVNEAKLDDSDDNEGEDDEDDDEEEGGEGKAAKSEGKRGKKRERTASADGRTPTTTAAGANFYPTAGGSMPQELLNALKPKDVTRKERDWAATVRALNAHMVTSIQDSHQALMQMTRSYNEIADRIAPSSTVRRHRADAATQHALRMQEVSMEVEVVRAEPKHLTLLVQLFDQYRVFYQQHSDPERAMQFLLERLEKNQSAIFIALPILNAAGDPVGSQLPPAAAAAPSGSVDPALTLEENLLANSMTSTLSVVSGSSSSTIGTASRSASSRLPAFAYGFAQLYPTFSSVRLSREWIVNDLFIHPSVRTRGIGSLLLTHAKKFAQDSGATGMQLSTQVNNLSAQKMYSRLDWRKDNEFVTYTHKL